MIRSSQTTASDDSQNPKASTPENSPEKGDKTQNKAGLVEGIVGGMNSAVDKAEARTNALKTLPEQRTLRFVTTKQSGPPYHHLDEYAWMRNILIWSNLDTVALLCFTLAIWAAVYLAYTRPTYVLDAPPSITDTLNEYYTMDGIDRDEFGMFIFNTLRTLKFMDPSGKPFLPGLAGQVNPDIIAAAQQEADRNHGSAESAKTVINLNITRITHVFVNPDDKRISAYIRGYIVVTQVVNIKPSEQNKAEDLSRVVIPYRAKVLVETDLGSKVNRGGYYLYSMTEKLGPDAVNWDKEQEDSKEK